MALVRGELVVEDGERDVGDARVECLHAVERGDPPAYGDDEPPKNLRLVERDTLGGQRPIALVQRIFFWVYRLVREAELERVKPSPEEDMRYAVNAGNGCGSDAQE